MAGPERLCSHGMELYRRRIHALTVSGSPPAAVKRTKKANASVLCISAVTCSTPLLSLKSFFQASVLVCQPLELDRAEPHAVAKSASCGSGFSKSAEDPHRRADEFKSHSDPSLWGFRFIGLIHRLVGESQAQRWVELGAVATPQKGI